MNNDLYTKHVQGRSHFENKLYSILFYSKDDDDGDDDDELMRCVLTDTKMMMSLCAVF